MYQYIFLLLVTLLIVCKKDIEQFANETCDIYQHKLETLEEELKKDSPQIVIHNNIPSDLCGDEDKDEDDDEDEEKEIYSDYITPKKQNKILLYIMIICGIILFLIIVYYLIQWLSGKSRHINISFDEALLKAKSNILMKKHKLKVDKK